MQIYKNKAYTTGTASPTDKAATIPRRSATTPAATPPSPCTSPSLMYLKQNLVPLPATATHGMTKPIPPAATKYNT